MDTVIWSTLATTTGQRGIQIPEMLSWYHALTLFPICAEFAYLTWILVSYYRDKSNGAYQSSGVGCS